MVKQGYTIQKGPYIGTGPFRVVSYSRGRSTLLERNPYYWQAPPHLEEIELVQISDITARVNALVSGQVDAISQVDPSQIATLKTNPNIKLLVHAGATWTAQTMMVDRPPFNDKNVRQALRYMVNRPQIMADAVNNAATIGNDLQNHFDPYAATLAEIPQRPYDPDHAKFLLKKAGLSKLNLTLSTAPASTGMVQSSTVIAQQAQAVGVDISLKDVAQDEFWVTQWLKAPFTCTFWGARTLNDFIGLTMWKGATQNETHWNDPSFTATWRKAQATVNPTARRELFIELQKTLWNEGGYLIWGFLQNVDAYSPNVKGLQGGVARDFNFYNFNTAYFA